MVLIIWLGIPTLGAKSFFSFLLSPRSVFNFGGVTSAAASQTLPSLAQGQFGTECKQHLFPLNRVLLFLIHVVPVLWCSSITKIAITFHTYSGFSL